MQLIEPMCAHDLRKSGLAASTIRQIHWLLSGAFSRAVRWRWITQNPMDQAAPPTAPTPNPKPPSARDAARLLAESWKDPDWGTLVWLAMTTGARRGLDAESVAVLDEHLARCQERAESIGVTLPPDAFVFSPSPDGSTHLLHVRGSSPVVWWK
jgi:integrase